MMVVHELEQVRCLDLDVSSMNFRWRRIERNGFLVWGNECAACTETVWVRNARSSQEYWNCIGTVTFMVIFFCIAMIRYHEDQVRRKVEEKNHSLVKVLLTMQNVYLDLAPVRPNGIEDQSAFTYSRRKTLNLELWQRDCFSLRLR